MRGNSFFKILKNENLLKVWLVQLFSSISATTLNFILIGKIFSLTQSSVAVAFYIFFYLLPTLILGPFVGVFIDDLNKKKILIYSNLSQSVIVLLYLLLKEKIWPIYAIVLFYSLGDEFFNPAVMASVPVLVEKKYYATVNSLFLLTNQSSIVVGSLIGGLMLKLLPSQSLVFPIVSLFLFFGSLLSLSLPLSPFRGSRKLKLNFKDPSSLGEAFDFNGFGKQLKEGYQFIKDEPIVLFPILLLAGLQGLIGMGLIVFPSLAKILKISFADSPFFLILPAIIGAILGGTIIEKRLGKLRKNIFILAGLYSTGAILLGFGLITLILNRPFLLAVPLTLGLGVAYVFIYIPLQTLIQEKTPFPVRGRVFSTLSTLITLSSFLPMLITTTLIDLLGLRAILSILGIIILTSSFYGHHKLDLILALGSKQ